MTLDEAGFEELTRRHRRELHVHCYRMLASFDEAEDAVQETLLRAWRARDTFEGGALARAWLYRIATNVCIDLRRASGRQLAAMSSFAEVPWLTPYPDRVLDEAAPEGAAIGRETIELAFLAAMQVLPTRQRAVLVSRDVLGWSAQETAAMLDTSVAAANSALQRARVTMQRHLPARRSEWTAGTPGEAEKELLDKFIRAHESGDAALAVSIAAEDLRITMPPAPMVFQGIATVAPLLANAFADGSEWRLVPTMANRMPTAASYMRAPGDTVFRAFKLDVLRVAEGRIVEITTFGHALFPRFGLKETYDGRKETYDA